MDTWTLASGLAIGLVGTIMLIWGKKQQSPRAIVGGLFLCVFPYFVGSLALTWLCFAGCLGGLYAWSRLDPGA